MNVKKPTVWIGAFVLLLGSSLAAQSASAGPPIAVNCAVGNELAVALGDAERGDKFNVTGNCTEGGEINVDQVILKGNATIYGTIKIIGAHQVKIKDLTITGVGDGVVGMDGAYFTIQNADVSNNDGSGILVASGSSATIKSNSTINSNGFIGIFVRDGSSAIVEGNEINDNVSDGILSLDGASVKAIGNVITDNGRFAFLEAGIEAGRARVLSIDNTLINNGWAGFSIWNDSGLRSSGGAGDTIVQTIPGTFAVSTGALSYADLRGATVTGIIQADIKSLLRIRTTALTGNIDLRNGSTGNLAGSLSGTGTVICTSGATTVSSAFNCGDSF